MSVGGLFLIVPDQFELSPSGIDALGLGTASHYTGDEGLLGWGGWLVDLANPVEDFKFLVESTEQMVSPLNQWSSDFLHNALDNHRSNIHTKRYGAIADVPGASDMMHSKRVSDPRKPPEPQPDGARGMWSDYWHYFWHPFGG
jgi:hypothetical protein